MKLPVELRKHKDSKTLQEMKKWNSWKSLQEGILEMAEFISENLSLESPEWSMEKKKTMENKQVEAKKQVSKQKEVVIKPKSFTGSEKPKQYSYTSKNAETSNKTTNETKKFKDKANMVTLVDIASLAKIVEVKREKEVVSIEGWKQCEVDFEASEMLHRKNFGTQKQLMLDFLTETEEVKAPLRMLRTQQLEVGEALAVEMRLNCEEEVVLQDTIQGRDDEALEDRIQAYEVELEMGYMEEAAEDLEAEKERIKGKINEQMAKTVPEVLTEKEANELRHLCHKYYSVFADKKSKVRLSNLDPMNVYLKPDAKPVHSIPREMGPIKKEAMKQKLNQMLRDGLVTRDTEGIWSSPAFMVKKPKGGFRLVLDMRELNEQVFIQNCVLPTIEMQTSWIPSSMKYYGLFDCLSGFDLLPLKQESQKFFGISTIYGLFKLKAAPMGFTNTPTEFQERVMRQLLGGVEKDSLFGNKEGGFAQWVDDSLAYAPTFEKYLQILERFFAKALEYKVRLNIDKCELVTKTASWCGRIIERGNWQPDQKYFSRILDLPEPVTLGQVEDLVFISTWLSVSIPQLSQFKEIFNQLALAAKALYVDKRGKTLSKEKRASKSVAQWWNPNVSLQYKDFLLRLKEASENTLTMYEPSRQLILVTDASNGYWSAILGLEEENSDATTLLEVPFAPIYYTSGCFRGSSLNWSTPDKEMFPVIRTLLRFRFITECHESPIKVFTDHRNLLYVLSPSRDVKQSSLNRLARWSLIIQGFQLRVFHVSSSDNRLADVLTRWGFSHPLLTQEVFAKEVERLRLSREASVSRGTDTKNEKENEVRTAGVAIVQAMEYVTRLKAKEKIPLVKLKDKEEKENARALSSLVSNEEASWNEFIDARISFLHPDFSGEWKPIKGSVLKKVQEQELDREKQREVLSKNGDGVYCKEGKIWIPEVLLGNFLWHAHVSSGHSSPRVLVETIKDFYLGRTKEEIYQALKTLKRRCLHCDFSPKIIAREIGEIPHGKVPGEVIHMDYLTIHGGYWLVSVDDLSRKIVLKYTASCDVKTVIDCLLTWHSHGGLRPSFTLVTDRGSHFCNRILRRFQEKFPYTHQMSIAYAHWGNGAAEVTHQGVVRQLRTLLSQYQADPHDWPHFTSLVEAFHNNRRRKDAGSLSPNEIWSGRGLQGKPLIQTNEQERLNSYLTQDPRRMFPVFTSKGELQDLPEDTRVQKYLEELCDQLQATDTNVFDRMNKKRLRARLLRNKSAKISETNFTKGDLVMIADVKTFPDKTRLLWKGPFVVLRILGTNVYEVEDPFRKTQIVHSFRMTYYDGQGCHREEAVRSNFLHMSGHFIVEEILDARKVGDKYELLVKWMGFQSESATWEVFENIWEDSMGDVVDYLESAKDENVVAAQLFHMHCVFDTANTAQEYELAQEILNDPTTVVKIPHWSPQEEQDLKLCSKAFGVAEFKPILAQGILPRKTRAQMVSKLQRWLGLENLREVKGLFMDLDQLSIYLKTIDAPRRQGKIIVRSPVDQMESFERRRLFTELFGNHYPTPLPKSMILDQTVKKEKEKEFVTALMANVEDIHDAVQKRHDEGTQLTVYISSPEGLVKRRADLDSGASITLLGKKMLHPQQMEYLTPVGERCIVNANGGIFKVLGELRLDFELKFESLGLGLTLRNVLTSVVDCENWHTVLIGKDVLSRLNVLPEDALRHKLLKEESGIPGLKVLYEAKQAVAGFRSRDREEPQAITRFYTEQLVFAVSDNISEGDALSTWISKCENEYLPKACEVLRKLPEGYEVHAGQTYSLENGITMTAAADRIGGTDLFMHEWRIHKEQEWAADFILPPHNCCAIQWDARVNKLPDLRGKKVGLAVIDAPWNTSTGNMDMDQPKLMEDSEIFEALNLIPLGRPPILMWVPLSKRKAVFNWLPEVGYHVKEELIWVKTYSSDAEWNSKGPLIKRQTEVCYLAVPASVEFAGKRHSLKQLIKAPIRRKGQKPPEFYEAIEKCFSKEFCFVDLFACVHNLRSRWISIGRDFLLPDHLHRGTVTTGEVPRPEEGKQVTTQLRRGSLGVNK